MAFIADPLAQQVIGCAMSVHRELGPGLLESTYTRCFRLELARQRIRFSNEVWLPIIYKATRLSRTGQGLLFNFNEGRLKDGIKSVILGASAPPRLRALQVLRPSKTNDHVLFSTLHALPAFM